MGSLERFEAKLLQPLGDVVARPPGRLGQTQDSHRADAAQEGIDFRFARGCRTLNSSCCASVPPRTTWEGRDERCKHKSQYNGCLAGLRRDCVTDIRARYAARSCRIRGRPPAGPELKYQTGTITLPNKVATLHLGEKYRYLDPNETNKLLMAWGNESDTTTQGTIVPADVEPFSESGWAVILTYEDDGHIDDSDATEIDYDDMLKDMQEGTEDHNDARKEAGFEAVHLIGWAEKPHYDASAKKLYWAKELNFEGSPSTHAQLRRARPGA